MIRSRTGFFAAWIAGLVVLLAGASWGFGQEVDLTGRVQRLEQPGVSLDLRVEAAEQRFLREHREGLFLTGYIFPGRDSVHMGDSRDPEGPYGVRIRDGEISFRSSRRDRGRDGFTVHTKEEKGGPTGLLLLFRMSGGQARMVDSIVFDPDKSFAFEDAPLYWLGRAEAEESFRLLKAAFEQGDGRIQSDLVFAISLHDSSRVTPFLKDTALGDHDAGVRKNAIFWLGNRQSRESYRALGEIFAGVRGTELKKQVVFAYSLSDREEAIREMIRIAREDQDREVRKSAIFWLGQKASDEAADSLQGMVEGSDEDDDIKKSAIFAISQLPKERSLPLLISIAKTHPSAALRKNAIFWLGQTGEEEALRFLEEILLKK